MNRVAVSLVISAGLASSALAGPKMDPQLKDKLLARFQSAKFAVALEEGMPAMPAGDSVLGADYYVVKCENGGVLTKSKSLMSLTQKASQTLDKGEIFTVDGVKVTDSGINLKLKTVRELYAGIKDVGKRNADIRSQYDQFGTELQFKFDAQYVTALSEENLKFIVNGVESHVKLFANDRDARAFASGEAKPEGSSSSTPAASATADSGNASVDSILARYVEALGGEAAIRKITSTVARGTFSMKLEGQDLGESAYELYQKAPNSRLEIYKGKLVTESSGCAGKTAWKQDADGGAVDVTGSALAEAQGDAIFRPELRMREVYSTLKLDGKVKVAGSDAYRIQAATASGSSTALYFDAKTGLLVRRDITQQGQPGQILVKDYREIDGVREPFLYEMSLGSGDSNKNGATLRIAEMQHNVPIDDARFKKPGSSAKAPLVIKKLGLKIDVPSDPSVPATVRDGIDGGVMVWGTGPTFAVSVGPVASPKTVEQMKEWITAYDPENVAAQTLSDGWLLTYENNPSDGRETWVKSQRTISGKSYSCEGSAKASESAKVAAIIAACKSLRQ